MTVTVATYPIICRSLHEYWLAAFTKTHVDHYMHGSHHDQTYHMANIMMTTIYWSLHQPYRCHHTLFSTDGWNNSAPIMQFRQILLKVQHVHFYCICSAYLSRVFLSSSPHKTFQISVQVQILNKILCLKYKWLQCGPFYKLKSKTKTLGLQSQNYYQRIKISAHSGDRQPLQEFQPFTTSYTVNSWQSVINIIIN